MESSKTTKTSICEVVPFAKYSGCGNDFILIDNRTLFFPWEKEGLIEQLCHRQQGIGADGLILLENSDQADFRMRIFNADGSEAEMCGNGVRCLMKFIQTIDPSQERCTLQTMQSQVVVQLQGEEVSVTMPIPCNFRWHEQIEEIEESVHFLNTGVPHAILFVEDLNQDKWIPLGRYLRYHPHYAPQGTNVNFAEIKKGSEVHLRTYERGVEGETLACGTGATATALAAAKIYDLKSPIQVIPRSKAPLTIAFQSDGSVFKNVTMTGPALLVQTGVFTLAVESNSALA